MSGSGRAASVGIDREPERSRDVAGRFSFGCCRPSLRARARSRRRARRHQAILRAIAAGFAELEVGDDIRMLEERKRRIGENEAVFRNVNQMVRPLDPALMTILCECGDAACRDQLLIAHEQYERVRNDSTLFILRPRHEAAETEEVVSKQLEFWIVRKRPGLPAAIARRTD